MIWPNTVREEKQESDRYRAVMMLGLVNGYISPGMSRKHDIRNTTGYRCESMAPDMEKSRRIEKQLWLEGKCYKVNFQVFSDEHTTKLIMICKLFAALIPPCY